MHIVHTGANVLKVMPIESFYASLDAGGPSVKLPDTGGIYTLTVSVKHAGGLADWALIHIRGGARRQILVGNGNLTVTNVKAWCGPGDSFEAVGFAGADAMYISGIRQ